MEKLLTGSFVFADRGRSACTQSNFFFSSNSRAYPVRRLLTAGSFLIPGLSDVRFVMNLKFGFIIL